MMVAKKDDRRGPPGRALRASGKDGPQVIESSGLRWTEEAEQLFLDHLAASCNVKLAAREAGFSTTVVYRRRRLDPGFAERWQAALDQGYARLETALVRAAADTLAGEPPDPDMPFPDMTVRDAINLLQLHRASAKGTGNRPGWRGRPRSLEEMRASILAKMEAIEAMRLSGGQPDAEIREVEAMRLSAEADGSPPPAPDAAPAEDAPHGKA